MNQPITYDYARSLLEIEASKEVKKKTVEFCKQKNDWRDKTIIERAKFYAAQEFRIKNKFKASKGWVGRLKMNNVVFSSKEVEQNENHG